MLIARTSNGRIINLADRWEKTKLERMKEGNGLFCPVCSKPVRLKLGTKRVPHFAHLKDQACAIQSEPESMYHLTAKRQLYRWLASQLEQVELEWYLQPLNQRPDLYIPQRVPPIAIEYQCASIPNDQIQKRTQTYLKHGIEPFWILGASRISKTSTSLYRLDELAFHALRFSPSSTRAPSLQYYCPYTMSFTTLHSIIPFTSRTIFATPKVTSIKAMTFPITTEDQSDFPRQFRKLWIQKLLHTRLYMHVNKDQAVVSLKKRMLDLGIPASLFPTEAGLPTKHLFWFESPAYVWQSRFLIDIIHPLALGTTFSFREVYRQFMQHITAYRIRTRKILRNADTHISFALMDYLQVLTKIGMIKRTSKVDFIKTKPVHFPSTSNEVNHRQKIIFDILEK